MASRLRQVAAAVLLAGLVGLAAGGTAYAQPTPPTTGSTPDVLVAGATQQVGGCPPVPGVAGLACDVVDVALESGVGGLVGFGSRAVLDGLVGFVVDGAAWLVAKVTDFVESSTTPSVTADWFRSSYRSMSLVAVVGLLPFLLLAVVQALVRQDVGQLLRSVLVRVPLAAIGTAGAVVVVDLLVQLTDGLSSWIAASMGADLSAFAGKLGTALVGMSSGSTTGGLAVAGLAALLGAMAVAFASFLVWLELLLRQAAVYVAVLFLPLGFMALVWPATAHWLRRLIEALSAVILSKFVIVAVMSLAAGALNVDVADDGYAAVVSGAAMMSLAAFAPYVLLRFIPVFEAGMSSQLEGTIRRPTAAVASPVGGGQIGRLVRQRSSAGSHSSDVGRAAGAGAASGGPAVAATGVGVAAAGVGRAAGGAARRVAADGGAAVGTVGPVGRPERDRDASAGGGARGRQLPEELVRRVGPDQQQLPFEGEAS